MMTWSTVLTLLIIAFGKTTSSSPSPSPWCGHVPTPTPTQMSFEGCFAVTLAYAYAYVGIAVVVFIAVQIYTAYHCKPNMDDNNKQYHVVLFNILSFVCFVCLESMLIWWFLNHRCYGVWNIIPLGAIFMIPRVLMMIHNGLVQVGLFILYVCIALVYLGWLNTWQESMWLVLAQLFNFFLGAFGPLPFAFLLNVIR